MRLPTTAADQSVVVHYFAYGANMASRVLQRRGVEPLAKQPARPLDQHHWVLAFRHRAGYATLLQQQQVANKTTEVAAPYGVLYALSRSDMEHLRSCEQGYRTITLPCITLHEEDGTDNELVDAEVFVSQPWNLLPASVPPRPQYLELLKEGAACAGLPDAYVARLEAVSTVTASGWGLPDTYYDTPARRASYVMLAMLAIVFCVVCWGYGTSE